MCPTLAMGFAHSVFFEQLIEWYILPHMKEYSIECAPPYEAGSNTSSFLEALSLFLKQNETNEASLVLLVDDVSYPSKTFDFDTYANWLGDNGHPEAHVYRESQFVTPYQEVRDLIDESQLPSELATRLHNNTCTSSLFIASWFLIRLGFLTSPIFPPELCAEKLYNIVPAHFKGGEDEALELIKATPYKEALGRIAHRFIET